MALSASKTSLFDPQALAVDQHFLIAYSGGADSTALLHFCAHHPLLKNRIRAIHVNHQLQSDADLWQAHCLKQCQEWRIECVIERVNLPNDSENSARHARRQAFRRNLLANETLLTAHHQQDQVETVLFRLFRGTGLKGLTGIQTHSSLNLQQAIIRPLLNTSKQQIEAYLETHQLKWVKDPSNSSNRYSRNHIRNLIVPEINAYSSDASDMIANTAINLQNSHKLLIHLMPDDNPLSLNQSIDVTFIHHWLQKKHAPGLTAHQLNNFLINIKQAAGHKHPLLTWASFRLMAWQDKLYLLKAVLILNETKSQLKWQRSIQMPCNGHLLFSSELPIEDLEVGYAMKGLKIKMAKHKQHKTIKKLHQEYKTPPWEKEITPFIFHHETLLAVGNWTSEHFDQLLTANNCQYSWQKPRQIL